MRVHSASSLARAGATPASRRLTGGAFEIAGSDPAHGSARAAGPRAIASLDALIALQSIDEVGERRRRIVKHGRTVLDTLEELKLGLLAGSLDAAALARLQGLARDSEQASGDPRLDGVMAEISLRMAVEIAKFSRR